MDKNEVRRLLLEQMLGNRTGVNVHMSISTLTPSDRIKSWYGEIARPPEAPAERLWFAYVDPSPDANFEHPVEYVFVDDQDGTTWVVHGTTPPDNLSSLEKIA